MNKKIIASVLKSFPFGKGFGIGLFSLFTFHLSMAQVSWFKSYGSNEADEGVSVVSDQSGCVYLAGSFTNTMMMDTCHLTYTGFQDMVVAKLDSSGNILWAKSFGGLYDDKPSALALTRDGYLIVAGSMFDSCWFGNLNVHGRGYTDGFIAKVDTSNGNVLWVKTVGSNGGYEYTTCVAVDSANNIWCGGSYIGAVIAESDTLYSNGSLDFYILKYDDAGNLLQSHSFGGEGSNNISSISADGSNNIYFCGPFTDTMQLGATSLISAGLLDVYWSCMNDAGTVLWAKRAGGLNTENVSSIRAFHDGSYYISGWVQDTAWFEGQLMPGGGGDIYIAHFDANNNFHWLREGYNLIANENSRNIVLDKFGSVYLTGQSNFVIQRLEDAGGRSEASEKACPFGDLVFLKYDTAGVLQWMDHTLGNNFNIGNGIAVDNLGSCFVAGYFADSIWLSTFLQTGLDGSDILLFRVRDNTFDPFNGINVLSENDLQANVYPNPAQGDFYVNVFSEKSRRACSVKMYSMQGVKQSEWKIYLEEGMNLLQLTSDASPGMYLLSLETGDEHARLKLVLH